MAPKTHRKNGSDYERERLENIRRNVQMMSALTIQRKAADPKPKPKTKTDRMKKKPRDDDPIIVIPRRSLRTRGNPSSESPTPSNQQQPGTPLAPAAIEVDASSTPPPPPRGVEPKTKEGNGSEYEQERLENIRRNREMMSALMLQRIAADLNQLKPGPNKRPPKRDLPLSLVIPRRRSTRVTRQPSTSSPAIEVSAGLIQAIKSSTWGGELGLGRRVENEDFDPRTELGFRSVIAAQIASDRITGVAFLPLVDRTVVVVGNKVGNLGFWDVDFWDKGGKFDDVFDGIYVYRPHSSSVSGISAHPFSPRKIFTSSYDGVIRLMDVEKEAFNMLISGNHGFFSMCQRPQDISSIYIGEGRGMLKVWDERAGKASSFWELHQDMINTIDFSPKDVHLMTTSSTDGSACIWDLRRMKKDKPKSIKLIGHQWFVQSSYFSPSGKYIATTSFDNNVGIASGADFDDISMVSHTNWTTKHSPKFRAIWGWDDSYLFIGNMKKAVDVISTCDGTTTALESGHITKIPSLFAAHPYKLGHLAGATSGNSVYLWTRE